MIEKNFVIPLEFDFFKHPFYPYGFKENFIIRSELNSAENSILCGKESTKNKPSDISPEYDAMLDVDSARKIRELHIKTKIQYTKVT